MKRLLKQVMFIVILLSIATVTASAQLKLHSNGKLSFMRTGTSNPYSPISLSDGGDAEDSTFFTSYFGDYNGMRCYTYSSPYFEGKCYGGLFETYGTDRQLLVGLKGEGGVGGPSTSSDPGSIGLWGLCNAYMYNRYGYGVLGTARGNYYSAAVCGISSAWVTSNAIPDDKYAGLFVGKTKVVGDLTVTGTVNGVVISPSAPNGSSQTRSINDESVSGKLQNLSAIAYHRPEAEPYDGPQPTFLNPEKSELDEMERLGIDPADLEKPEEDVMAKQIQEKEHYGLSAEELEEVFPDLVYTDKDGNKSVNYVEMVPLLLQYINELNARLSALDGGVKAGVGGDLQSSVSARNEASARQTTDIAKTTAIQAMLYQNAPNPFTAQTEIRFSLPDDAPQAYIYIFDMTGKMQKQIPVDSNQQSVTINGYELSAGIYLYSLVVGGQEIDTKRMILSR